MRRSKIASCCVSPSFAGKFAAESWVGGVHTARREEPGHLTRVLALRGRDPWIR